MENLKNIAPVEGFDWEAYEKGDVLTGVSHEELEKAYDNTLNKVGNNEVVEVMLLRQSLLTSCFP